MADRLEQPAVTATPRAAGDILALASGTTLAIWAVGYVGWTMTQLVPAWAVAAAMLLCLAGGGLTTGLVSRRGWRGGLAVGLITTSLNLLILGSLVHSEGTGYAPPLLIWLPGTVFASTLICTLAAALGAVLRRRRTVADHHPNWSFWFSMTTVGATLLLLLAGGLVTGRGAGLAVPDWPQSYGYNMFFYPLTRMTGNIYFEHAHRLLGALVGLTTIALAVHLWLIHARRWWLWLLVTAGGLATLCAGSLSLMKGGQAPLIPWLWLAVTLLAAIACVVMWRTRLMGDGMSCLAALAILAVCTQGIMGGFRVALADGSGAQVAAAENETGASTVLRVMHGVVAQLFLACLVALAAACSDFWKRRPRAAVDCSTDRGLTAALLLLLCVQLLLGALLRHLDRALMLHITVAVIVLFTGLAAGMRILAVHGRTEPALHRLSWSLTTIIIVQPLLGVMALIFRGASGTGIPPTAAHVAFTTLHQVTGAVLLANATALAVLVHRLVFAGIQSADIPGESGLTVQTTVP